MLMHPFKSINFEVDRKAHAHLNKLLWVSYEEAIALVVNTLKQNCWEF